MNNQDEEQFEKRSDYRQREDRPHRHRGWKIFGWLVLIVAVIAGIYAFLAWHNVKVTTNQMFNSSGATRQRDAQKVLDQRRPVSILLLGTDTGALGRSYKGRTDTVMVMTINPQKQQTTIVSIPRDMKVNLPGYPEDSPAKINAAYTFGGVKETINVVQKHFNIPIAWTTDVNGSAYGEYVLSTLFNKRINSLVYYTIGTGCGAGAVVDGKFVGELGHPEMGHIRLKRHPDDLDFKGICPFHGDCLEGLVSGPTFEARTGKKGKDVPLTDHVWDIMAYYVAQAALDTTLMFRPGQIIFGGGVVSEEFLKKVRREFKKLLNNYVDVGNVDEYITMPLAKNNGSATIGDFALALKAATE